MLTAPTTGTLSIRASDQGREIFLEPTPMTIANLSEILAELRIDESRRSFPVADLLRRLQAYMKQRGWFDPEDWLCHAIRSIELICERALRRNATSISFS